MGNQQSSGTLKLHLVSDKTDAARRLQQAEQQDFYLDECRDDPQNAKARQSLSYYPQTLHKTDVSHYSGVLNRIQQELPYRLVHDLQEIAIIPLMPSADEGMPHTRPKNIICVSHLPHIDDLSTMIHELWHIHQRIYTAMWRDVFHDLGWKEWNGKLPTHLDKNRRLNPDTVDSPLWIYQDTWIPLPLFRDISRPNLKETDVWFYRPSQGDRTKEIPSSIQGQYPQLPAAAYEHPRELAAYLLSEPQLYYDTPGYKQLITLMGHLSVSKQ